MGQGVDTKTDPKQVVAGKLIELENATFQSTNRLTKRPGSVELAASTKPSQGNAIATFQDQLVVADGSSVYSYGSQFDRLVSRGSKTAVDVSVESISKNAYNQANPHSCVLNNISIYSWQDSRVGVYYSIFDNKTQQTIVFDQKIPLAIGGPKIVPLDKYFVIFYVSLAAGVYSLKAIYIDSTDPTMTPATFSVATLGTNLSYDATAVFTAGVSTKIILAYANAAGNIVASGVTTTFTPSSPVGPSLPCDGAVAVIVGDFGNIRVAFGNGATVSAFSVPLAVNSVGTVVAVASQFAFNITGIETASNVFLYYYQVTGETAAPGDYVIRQNQVNNVTPGTPGDFCRSLAIWSKPFVYGSTHYLVALHESNLQPTYFVLSASGEVIAKIAPNNGGGAAISGALRAVNSLGSGSFEFAYLFKDRVQSVEGDVYAQLGVNSCVLKFGDAMLNEAVGENLHFGGGVVSAFDGVTACEQNFHLYPESPIVTKTIYQGLLAKKSYQYTSCYEWVDSQGQIHQSQTAVPTTIDFTTDINAVGAQSNLAVDRLFINTTGSKFINYYANAEISGSVIPAGTYMKVPTDRAYFLNPQLSSSATGASPDILLTGNFKFPAITSVGSKTVQVKAQYFNSYLIDTTAGSPVVKFYDSTGLDIGNSLYFSAASVPATIYDIYTIIDIDINDPTIVTLNKNAPATETAKIVHLSSTRRVQLPTTSLNYFVLNLNFTTNPFKVGDTVYCEEGRWAGSGAAKFYATVTAIADFPGLTQRVYFDKSFDAYATSDYWYFYAPIFPISIKAGQEFTATAGFSGSFKAVSYSYLTGILVSDTAATSTSTSAVLITDNMNSVEIKWPTLRVTNKPNPIRIAAYRTEGNGTLFYRLNSVSGSIFTPLGTVDPLINNKTVDYISYTDEITDSALIGNEQLYTTGGVLDNCAPPAAKIFTQYKNRMVAVSSEDPYTWWFSKPVGTNIPVQFCPYFYKKIPEQGGPITALGVMDDKLIFFKKSSIFIVVGTGPNNLGLQDDFNDAELVTTDTGCAEPKSVVRTPVGLMYKSAKGIYLLNRGLNVQYVGAAVEAYNSIAITSSELIENSNQVRFTLSSGVSLVYDYFFEQWSVFTNQNAIDSCVYDSKFTYLRPDGKIYKEAANVWTDGGQPIYIKLRSSWLQFNGIQGLERLYNVMVLGEYKSPHTLTVNVLQDYVTTPTQTTPIPVTSDPGVYQYKIYITRQKTNALQFLVQESQTAPYGEGLSISALGMEIGVKKGLNTLPAGKLYG